MLIGGASNVLSFGIGGGSLNKMGGNVIENVINNARDSLLANTTRMVVGKEIAKTKKGIAKNIIKNICKEFGMSVTETFCSSYATEVINYVFKPMSQN